MGSLDFETAFQEIMVQAAIYDDHIWEVRAWQANNELNNAGDWPAFQVSVVGLVAKHFALTPQSVQRVVELRMESRRLESSNG